MYRDGVQSGLQALRRVVRSSRPCPLVPRAVLHPMRVGQRRRYLQQRRKVFARLRRWLQVVWRQMRQRERSDLRMRARQLLEPDVPRSWRGHARVQQRRVRHRDMPCADQELQSKVRADGRQQRLRSCWHLHVQRWERLPRIADGLHLYSRACIGHLRDESLWDGDQQLRSARRLHRHV